MLHLQAMAVSGRIFTRLHKEALISINKVGLRVDLLLCSPETETQAPRQERREALVDHERSFTKHLTLLFFGLTLPGAQSVVLWLADNIQAFGED